MLSDGEVIGIAVLIAVTIVVSIAYVFWIQGNPFMDTGIDIVVIAHSVNYTGDGWRIWLLIGNHGSRTADIEYLLLNNRVCNIDVNVTRNRVIEHYTLPGQPVPIEPGESIEMVFHTANIKGCDITVSPGLHLRLTLRTSQGRDYYREIIIP
ncbi:hypothetical protein [Desulfurococcus amylolyticus]|uniref:hypothetical protein n=1 Tax=Desulfurococcus TaxID=2273 RepID=UPI0023F4F930|nr:hypothetical protein [Desulfurococcus amylolyticus]